MPRRVEQPRPWRSALLIYGGLLLLAVVAAILIRFAFTPYEFIDNLPNERPAGSGEQP
jgi:hypothetical protein